jgi:hypothetical protein
MYFDLPELLRLAEAAAEASLERLLNKYHLCSNLHN